MTWSHSRITTYEDCPYSFYLKYISKEPKERKFFSDFGLLMHKLLQKYLDKEATPEELVRQYLTEFRSSVVGRAPNLQIFNNYFHQGLEYLQSLKPMEENIIGTEQEVNFKIGDKDFIGFIDKLSKDHGIVITDHKSRALKPRSNRSKPLKSDLELDKYLRQLYLYSAAVEQIYHKLPKKLVFNCFRTKTQIEEPFDPEKYEQAKNWALTTIDKIDKETEWNPNIDEFRCRYLCDVCDHCDYYQLFCH